MHKFISEISSFIRLIYLYPCLFQKPHLEYCCCSVVSLKSGSVSFSPFVFSRLFLALLGTLNFHGILGSACQFWQKSLLRFLIGTTQKPSHSICRSCCEILPFLAILKSSMNKECFSIYLGPLSFFQQHFLFSLYVLHFFVRFIS